MIGFLDAKRAVIWVVLLVLNSSASKLAQGSDASATGPVTSSHGASGVFKKTTPREPPGNLPVLDWGSTAEGTPLLLAGFWDLRTGVRTGSDPEQDAWSLGEARLQLEFSRDWDYKALRVVADILFDPAGDRYSVDLEDGEGVLDLREANYVTQVSDTVDMKIGRQILTWGTGDLLFLNDFFPKDWNAFFIGRDVEYLKAPSDALKLSFFNQLANVDLVYTPRFDADRYIDGRRVSYFNPAVGEIVGDKHVVRADKPDDWFSDDEIAVRIYRNLRGFELALYGYDGYWKSPAGTDSLTGKALFPRLRAFGASIRGAVAAGLGTFEISDYNSRDDSDGDDPFIQNGEIRALIGYEQELAREFFGGLQFYLEHKKDYSNYQDSLPAGVPVADKNRRWITLRLTKLLMNQNLELSLFTFYSPTDEDGYIRPRVKYKVSDDWLVEGGANIFFGEKDYTFFGQFENNTNIYGAVRYGF